MGRLPCEVRTLTPQDTALLVRSWNDAQGGATTAAPTDAEYEELVKKYG